MRNPNINLTCKEKQKQKQKNCWLWPVWQSNYVKNLIIELHIYM